jgi:serine/threonine protein kinase
MNPHDATTSAGDRSLSPEHPDHIGPYRILQLLGEGGMGTVYVAEQTAPISRRVALKVLKLGMDTKQFVARFDAERQRGSPASTMRVPPSAAGRSSSWSSCTASR